MSEIIGNSETIKAQYLSYSSKIDKESEFWSGGFERHENFRKIIDLREVALPLLLEELADRSDSEDRHNPWWRLQAVGTIAANLEKRIVYSREIRGRLEPVREATLEWGVQYGYIGPDQAEFS
jgi:hypothetical protein